jgi:hypothetical protein
MMPSCGIEVVTTVRIHEQARTMSAPSRRIFRADRLTLASLSACAVGAIITIAVMVCSRLELEMRGVLDVAPSLALLVIMALYGNARGMPGVACICSGLAVMAASAVLAFSISAGALTIGAPLIDRHLAAADAIFGFDARTVSEAIARLPAIPGLLGHIYCGSSLLAVPLLFLLAFVRRYDRGAELAFLFAATILMCSVISILVPAAGAFEYLGIDAGLQQNLPPNSGVYYLSHFHAFRDGSRRSIDWADPTGLVVFPSFHACMALMPLWVARGMRWLMAPLGFVAVGALASIIPIGGHYVVDIFGGALVTIAAIAVARRVTANQSATASRT